MINPNDLVSPLLRCQYYVCVNCGHRFSKKVKTPNLTEFAIEAVSRTMPGMQKSKDCIPLPTV